jgi:hypothetical protein
MTTISAVPTILRPLAPPGLSQDSRLQAKARVLVGELSGEAILLDLGAGRYYALNSSARKIWELMTSGFTVGGALATLEEEFDASREVLEADLETLLIELLGVGLLVQVGPADSVSSAE